MAIPQPRIDQYAMAIWNGQIYGPRAETLRQHRHGQDGDIIHYTGTLMPVDSRIDAVNWATSKADAYAVAAALEALENTIVQVVDGHDVLWPSVLIAEITYQVTRCNARETKPTLTGSQIAVTHRLDVHMTLRAQTPAQL